MVYPLTFGSLITHHDSSLFEIKQYNTCQSMRTLFQFEFDLLHSSDQLSECYISYSETDSANSKGHDLRDRKSTEFCAEHLEFVNFLKLLESLYFEADNERDLRILNLKRVLIPGSISPKVFHLEKRIYE